VAKREKQEEKQRLKEKERDAKQEEKERKLQAKRALEETKNDRGRSREQIREDARIRHLVKRKALHDGEGSAALSATGDLEDELLDLAEGEREHQMGFSSDEEPVTDRDGESRANGYVGSEYDRSSPPPVAMDPDHTPSGLRRAEVIARIESNDLSGLTEDDVKAVQDEMWARQKAAAGDEVAVRKDGKVRKKPGPAKGWKKLRGVPEGRPRKSIGQDLESEAASSTVGDDLGADEEIAALLGDSRPKSKKGVKRRKFDIGDEANRFDSDDDAEEEETELNGEGQSNGKKKSYKVKEPGVGKGRWTRPPKPEKELKKTEAILSQLQDERQDVAPQDDAAIGNEPKGEDPRGVSEHEARSRLGLVEDLQKQIWVGVVRDVPRVSSLLPATVNSWSELTVRCTVFSKLSIPWRSKTVHELLKLQYEMGLGSGISRTYGKLKLEPIKMLPSRPNESSKRYYYEP
jgi:hypothetical protein